jgi:SAM-dependent methyltransferase
MVSNMIEHAQNAVEFLHGIHNSLKPGGLLIFHDRYYKTPERGDAVLGRNVYLPIRLTRRVFDHFLSDFDIIFNNCDGHNTIRGW